VARWQNNIADVAVIPYTYENTNIRDRKPGDAVNLEGDVLGKYVERYLDQRNFAAPVESPLTVARLLDEGF
jgi:riboflavin synthase